jgi:hypothetical protein
VAPSAVIFGFELDDTTTESGIEEAEHPLASVWVTEKTPVATTAMDGVVAPVLQVLPVGLEEVRITVSPKQIVVGPLGKMVGVAGGAFTNTDIGDDTLAQALFSVTV